MTLKERISALVSLGQRLKDTSDPKIEMAILKAYQENRWFTPENSKKAINAIQSEFLHEENLLSWTDSYDFSEVTPKKIGLVLAGNIPLVGFHDLLCTFISGHHAVIKTSSKDDSLIKMIIGLLIEENSKCAEYFTATDRLERYDAVIATGSNNTAQHFEYYFRDYPKIIRKNRVSVAVLHGNESQSELELLGDDIFDYFGLGCRNVSKIFIPEDYPIDQLFEAFFKYQDIIHHNKYKNNYDYNEAIWLMGQDQFFTNGFLHLKEEKSLYSRIGSCYYERYDDISKLKEQLTEERENLQCISTNTAISGLTTISLGRCQSPSLNDYADNVDTLEFLINIS